MKRLMLATMLSGVMLLGGWVALQDQTCAAPKSIYDVAACAKKIIVDSCKFSVSIDNLIKIIQVGEYQTAVALGGAVCAAVTATTLSTRQASRVPMVSGVPVRGNFVTR